MQIDPIAETFASSLPGRRSPAAPEPEPEPARSLATIGRSTAALLVVALLAAGPAAAARRRTSIARSHGSAERATTPRGPAAPRAPAGAAVALPAPAGFGALKGDVWAKKQRVEAMRSQVEALAARLSDCCKHAVHPPLIAACGPMTDKLSRSMAAGLWSYNTGNYDDAFRNYARALVEAGQLSRQCDLARAASDRCVVAVRAAEARLQRLDDRIARVSDPIIKDSILKTYNKALADLRSLEASCTTTNPATVPPQIAPHFRKVEQAFLQRPVTAPPLTGYVPRYTPAIIQESAAPANPVFPAPPPVDMPAAPPVDYVVGNQRAPAVDPSAAAGASPAAASPAVASPAASSPAAPSPAVASPAVSAPAAPGGRPANVFPLGGFH